MTSSSRLERAMEVFLDSQEQGISRDETIARNPDLADLLDPLFGGGADDAAGDAFGDYEVVREVGRGGMGIVYEARQRSLGRRIALKVLVADAANTTQLTRFRREAMTLARLDHRHIVRILDVGETSGRHWLAMEFVDGETLDQRLEALRGSGGHRGSSLRELVEIVADLASALQHVHDAGVLHRDVKPSNVLLRSGGHALLSDFGLARDETAPTVTQVGVVAGTPHYMSPEHLLGGNALCPASDVWSLGALLYECITLKRPFGGVSDEQVLRRILTRDPVDPRRLHRGLHRDLAAITLKALEKDLGRRYATAAELGDDLRAFLELRPVQARPPTTTQRLRRWARREPLKAAFAASLAVALGLAGFVAWRLPDLRAGERAQLEEAYENEIAAGLAARAGRDADTTMRHLRRAMELKPCGESFAAYCVGILTFQGAEKALAELDRLAADRSDDDTQRARALILARTGRVADAEELERRLGPPVTPMAMSFTAARLIDRGDAAAMAAARELMSMAVHISRPRLVLLAQWAAIAPPEQQPEAANALLRLWPDNPLAMHLAAAQLQHLEPQRALALQQRVVDMGFQDQYARLNLAIYANKAGQPATAVAAARAAFTGDKISDDQRAGLLKLLNDIDPVQRDAALAEWLAREPGNASALREDARRLNDAGRHAEAVAVMRRAVAARPGDVDMQFFLGMVMMDAGELDEATDLARELVAESPTHEASHLLLSGLCGKRRDADGVLTELRRWANVCGTDTRAWMELARALQLYGGEENCREALRAIANADYLKGGRDTEVLELRAAIHEALGEDAAAAQCRERAKAQPAPAANGK